MLITSFGQVGDAYIFQGTFLKYAYKSEITSGAPILTFHYSLLFTSLLRPRCRKYHSGSTLCTYESQHGTRIAIKRHSLTFSRIKVGCKSPPNLTKTFYRRLYHDTLRPYDKDAKFEKIFTFSSLILIFLMY